MKAYLFSALFLFTLFNSAFAYEVRWHKRPKDVDIQKDGVVEVTSSYAFFISEILPTKKIASIVDVEIKKNKKSGSSLCDKNFFPAEKLNIKQVKRNNLHGIHFVRGVWEDNLKYVVASCVETKKGFKTSTAYIRLPFYRRIINQTQFRQLMFFKDGAVLKTDKKTVQNLFLKELINLVTTQKIHAIIPSGPSTSDLVDSLDGLSESISEGAAAADNLSESVDGASETIDKVSKGFFNRIDEVGDHIPRLMDQADRYADIAEDFNNLGEKWIEQSESWLEAVNTALSPGHFFKVGLATAAGAALGSAGVNIVLNGITTGAKALVEFLDRKGKSYKNELEVDKLKAALARVRKNHEDLENELDRFVLSLPIVKYYNDFDSDSYQELENELYDSQKRTELTLEQTIEDNRKKFRELGETCGDECQKKMSFSNQRKLEQDLDSINQLYKLIKARGEINLEDYCDKIGKMIQKWHEAELLVSEARVRLYGKKDRSSYNDVHLQELKRQWRKIKRNPIKAAESIAANSKKALKNGEKSLTKEFKNRFNKGDFKEKNNFCQENWCRSSGLMVSKSVSCSQLKIDLQKSARPVFPEGLERLPLSNLGYKDDASTRNFSKTQKIQLLDKFEKNHQKRCFQTNFKKYYPKDLAQKINCSPYEFENVGSMNDLAKCSQDYLRMEEIYLRILTKRDAILERKEDLSEVGYGAEASTQSLMASERAMDDLANGVDEIIASAAEEISKDYPHFGVYQKYCSEKQPDEGNTDVKLAE